MRETLTQQLRRQRMEAAYKGLAAPQPLQKPQPPPILAEAPFTRGHSFPPTTSPLKSLDSTGVHSLRNSDTASSATGAAHLLKNLSPTKPDVPSPTKSGGAAPLSARLGRLRSTYGEPLLRGKTLLGSSLSTGHRKGLCPLETGVEAGNGEGAERHVESGEGPRRHFDAEWDEQQRPERTAKEEETRLATLDFLQEMHVHCFPGYFVFLQRYSV